MKHIRIDEGFKRGARVQAGAAGNDTTVVAVRKTKSVLAADLFPATVIERYLNNERTADIAASYGVSHVRLNQWLLEHAEEPWRKAIIARTITALEIAQDELDDARDPMMLARAREQVRNAQWLLERLFNRLFGQQTHVTVEHVGDLGERLRRSRERLIEKAAVIPTTAPNEKEPG